MNHNPQEKSPPLFYRNHSGLPIDSAENQHPFLQQNLLVTGQGTVKETITGEDWKQLTKM
ncbi:hypothetical protein [Prosthecochloris sp. SCSIO W1103]|uniref:hypothetical protein n=1 Tax=Prosthecochloris sp. SCSIO W1103 TaxID=2992244 RepID=UPI00223CE404|nr:hypothetical protein [Prosthecochloris sp. SCSIO W1103]UZJ38325.1 hypothetical protein OO005_03755 [Prosthecochloris sp. SCSIO W1103]